MIARFGRRFALLACWCLCVMLFSALAPRSGSKVAPPRSQIDPSGGGSVDDRPLGAAPPSVPPGEPVLEIESAKVEDSADILREHLPVSLILEYATLLIAVETIVFAIFLGAFGYFEWARYKKLQESIESERNALDKRIEAFKSDLEGQRKELAEERQNLRSRVEVFKDDLQSQENRLAAYQRFLEAVLSQHSDLLVGLIEGFGSALRPEEDRRLRSLIAEASAVLDLFHPDRVKVDNALWHLEQIGADNAVAPLVQLRSDPAAEAETRVKAQIVLSKVQERLKEEQKKRLIHQIEEHRPSESTGGVSRQGSTGRKKGGRNES